MNKKLIVVSLISVLLISATVSSAAETGSSGADQTGTSLFLGYDRSYLSYKEFINGDMIDEDTGWNNGVYIEARHDDETTFFRFLLDYVATDSATYNGSLQNGTPVSMSTDEKFLTLEGNVGFKTLNFSTATLAPYIGLGYRDWQRGKDMLPDYKEDYSWWYIVAGGNLAYRFDRLVIAADVALTYPLGPKMTTNVAGLYDEATFDLKPYLGFRIEVPVNYEVSQDKNMKIFVFGTPFYQTWKLGASDPVAITRGGIPVTQGGIPVILFEPDSTTVMYGFRLGMGLRF